MKRIGNLINGLLCSIIKAATLSTTYNEIYKDPMLHFNKIAVVTPYVAETPIVGEQVFKLVPTDESQSSKCLVREEP